MPAAATCACGKVWRFRGFHMRNARIAEWILSLVLSPDRSATAIGDWLEDASERGILWFWSCVLRTATSQVWRELTDSPFFMASLALRGWLFGLFLSLASFALIIPVSILIALCTHWMFHSSPHEQLFESILGSLMGWALSCACKFQTGKWIARRAPGRETAACIALSVVQLLLINLLAFLVVHFWGSEVERFVSTHPAYAGTPLNPSGLFTSSIFFVMILFAGAQWVRHKPLRGTAG
jgi:hypothetical protein